MPGPVPQTMTADGKAVGARTPPHWLSLLCFPSCAISGYQTGDPTKGLCAGKALCALILQLTTCCLGGIYALLFWQPDPNGIQGDGTQRTVEDRCRAPFLVGGVTTVAFWEAGDFFRTPGGGCTWCDGDALIACILHFAPHAVGLPPVDWCYAMCCWQPNSMNFKRATWNHGGGQSIVGAPVQVANANVALKIAMPAQVSGGTAEGAVA